MFDCPARSIIGIGRPAKAYEIDSLSGVPKSPPAGLAQVPAHGRSSGSRLRGVLLLDLVGQMRGHRVIADEGPTERTGTRGHRAEFHRVPHQFGRRYLGVYPGLLAAVRVGF